MGCSSSQLVAKLILPHELRVGDHILIKNLCGSINAIYLDDETNRCIYLDVQTGYVTETYLSTLCNDRDKLYKYDYSTKCIMNPQETVLNAKFFAARGKFNDYCLCRFSTSYNFAYNCKINKYINENKKTDRQLLIDPNSLKLCINEQSESSITNNDIIGDIIGGEGLNKTHKKSISPNKNKALAIQINRVYESQNVLIKKLHAMDEQIKTIQNIQKRFNLEKETSVDLATQSIENKNELNATPIKAIEPITITNGSSMHTSMTLTPIRSETGVGGGVCGSTLGVLVVPDFSADSSAMSISPNEMK